MGVYARHVFGHYLADLHGYLENAGTNNETQPYADLVADVIADLIRKDSK